MANLLILNQPYVNVGLGSFTYTVSPTQLNPAGSGIYRVSCQTTVPSAVATGDGAGSGGNGSQGPAVSSSLSIVVKQNGSTVYTAPALSPTQSALQFYVDINCSNGDALEVDLTSSNPSDNLLNSIQTTVSLSNGI